MQHLVNKVYKGKTLDKLKTVSKFEYEQKDIRHKLDLADIYLQLNQIQEALSNHGVVVEQTEKQEEKIVEMVVEDRRAIDIELLELAYQRRMEAYEQGAVSEKLRRFFFGQPKAPVVYEEEVSVPVESEADKQVKIDKLMKSINQTETNIYEDEQEKIQKATQDVLNAVG